jgi:hypothetical protein
MQLLIHDVALADDGLGRNGLHLVGLDPTDVTPSTPPRDWYRSIDLLLSHFEGIFFSAVSFQGTGEAPARD